MFSWWKNHFQTKTLPAASQAVLANFQTDEMPVALAQIMTACDFDGQQLTIELPFPMESLQPVLLAELQSAGFSGALTVTYQHQAPAKLGSIKHIILVASGKGGVGKSTTAVNVAVALAREGAKTGLLDADIYGPSIPTMFGVIGHQAKSPDEKHLLPLFKAGVHLQSIGFLVDPTAASVWRGPMASQALTQLLNETLWPELDYLVVDMPPGTGDIQLTMAQKIPVSGAIIVTTPQDVALADAQKGISMFRQVNIPLLGLIENMSFYQCPSCGEVDDIFGTDGGLSLANRYHVPVLGQLPLVKAIRQQSDQGQPIALDDTQQSTEIYRKIARQVIFALYWRAKNVSEQQPEILFTDD